MWKNLIKEEKDKYFTLARKVDAEHKRKYPGGLIPKIDILISCDVF